MKRKSGKFQPRYMTRKLSATALSRQGLGGLDATRALLGKRQSRSLTADSVWSVCVCFTSTTASGTDRDTDDCDKVRSGVSTSVSLSAQCLGAGVSFRPM